MFLSNNKTHAQEDTGHKNELRAGFLARKGAQSTNALTQNTKGPNKEQTRGRVTGKHPEHYIHFTYQIFLDWILNKKDPKMAFKSVWPILQKKNKLFPLSGGPPPLERLLVKL